jgi:methionyl-tRNA formyltransferase
VTAVRTVFLGSGPFGVKALRNLAADGRIELVGIVTAPPRPAGRGRALASTDIDHTAGELGIGPILTPVRLRAPEAVGAVLALRPALAVLADYGQIVPPALLDLPNGALNLHPSLLPRHRGASPIPAAILAGDSETGITLMRMDAGLDTGPIVATERLALDGTETAPALEARLTGLAADLLAGSIGPWLAGDLPATSQPADGATLTRPLRREDGRLDPGLTAGELERRVRALLPWPGTFLDAATGRLAVHAAHVAPSEGGDEPGTLVGHADGLALATVGGRLVLDEVQPAGGRRMTGAALRRGRPGLVERP